MTQVELARLRDLLAKLLLEAHKKNHTGTFKLSWKLLYALGAKVHVDGPDVYIINPKGP